MRLVALSDIGVSRRDNQDNFWCSRLKIQDTEVGVVCLCDGMGGLNKGGLASKIVTESIRDYFLKGFSLDGLVDVINEANRRIFDMGVSEGRPLGTTCTILVCRESSYKVFHVGDTRCYKINNEGIITKITEDHSALTKYGITYNDNPELFNKYKSKLTRCIGVKPSVVVDEYDGGYLEGDRFIVCSDGFWHYLEYGNVISGDEDLRELIDKCIENGEKDNISLSILKV